MMFVLILCIALMLGGVTYTEAETLPIGNSPTIEFGEGFTESFSTEEEVEETYENILGVLMVSDEEDGELKEFPTKFSFDFSDSSGYYVEIDKDVSLGDHLLVVTARDSDGNYSKEVFTVHVTEDLG